MNDCQPSPLPERNPETHRAHRREVLLQITLPLVIGVIIVLVLAVLAALGAPGNVSRWADVSLIWLIIPMLLVALIFLVVFGGLAFGVFYLIRLIPGYARQVQDFFTLVGAKVKQGSDMAVEPVLRVQSFIASLNAVKRNLRRK